MIYFWLVVSVTGFVFRISAKGVVKAQKTKPPGKLIA